MPVEVDLNRTDEDTMFIRSDDVSSAYPMIRPPNGKAAVVVKEIIDYGISRTVSMHAEQRDPIEIEVFTLTPETQLGPFIF